MQASDIKIGFKYKVMCTSDGRGAYPAVVKILRIREDASETRTSWHTMCSGCPAKNGSSGGGKECYSYLEEILEELSDINTLGNFPKKTEEVSADGCIQPTTGGS